MPKLPKIILRASPDCEAKLDQFVEECLRDGVNYIAVMGHDCSRIEDIIDEILVGDASDESRFILTSFHVNQSLEEVIEFVTSLTGKYEGEVEVVDL